MINNMLPLFASQYEVIWEEIMEVNQKPLEAFFFRHFYFKFKIGANIALKFLKDKSWVCGEVIVRNLYGAHKCSF